MSTSLNILPRVLIMSGYCERLTGRGVGVGYRGGRGHRVYGRGYQRVGYRRGAKGRWEGNEGR